MTQHDGGHERMYRWLLRFYPAEFRARFSAEMAQLFSDQLRDSRTNSALAGTARTWLRTISDLAVTAVSEHAQKDRSVAHSLATTPPSTFSRVLGLVGILGGAVLIAAFIPNVLPNVPWGADLFNLRLALFNAGAMAIVIGVHRRQASVAPTVALLGTVPALLANAWHLVMIVRVVAQPGPPGVGNYGPIYMAAIAVMWLADAWFGLVALRLGVVSRWGAIALAIGSVLAFTPWDHLELTRDANPAIFVPLGLAGVALNGIGWILLGLDVATRRRASETEPREEREVRRG